MRQPGTGGAVVDIAAIDGVTVPVTGEIPVTTITENEQYTGTVEWSPEVSGTFAAKTAYTATITLTAKEGYTLQGVEADFFIMAVATSVTNNANSGVITAVFPKTAGTPEDPAEIDIAAIHGVTPPVAGGIPVTEIIENTQYRGTVTWNDSPSTFTADTVYTATITLTAKICYTLTGVTANFFTVEGADSVTNAADSGVITAVFPAAPTYGISLSSPAATRQVTINMYDSYGDGWNGGALRINVNGINTNVTVQDGYSTNTYTFNVAVGDAVQLYWVNGSYDDEVSFIAYYTDTPPSPAFNPSGWSGTNAFVYKLQGTYISGGTLLGSFTGAAAQLMGGTYTFPAANFNYGAQTPLSVTVTNTGNRPTGSLAVALSGANAGSFALSGTSVNSIAVSGNGAFTVAPVTGLAAGTYTATVTVSGGNGITANFNVSFTVNPATYGISLSLTGKNTFALPGYGAQTPLSVTVTNTGNQPTGQLTLTRTGANPGSFTTGAPISSIAVSGNSTFTVAPVTGLAVGTYTTIVTVSGGNGITANFDFSFTVNASILPMEMVLIPGGSFQMGKKLGSGSGSDVPPVHTETLTDFYMGIYEVTQAQYQVVMGSNPSYFYSAVSGENRTRLPVDSVSWYNTLVFCNKLSVMEGFTPAYRISGSTDPVVWGTVPTSSNAAWNAVEIVSGSTGYRLPTEAQWEYAAKGGDPTASGWVGYTFSGSDNADNVAWYGNNSNESHEVGKKAVNGLGIYDMTGNLMEWCWDWHVDYINVYRAIRGGSWNSPYWGQDIHNVDRLPGAPYMGSYNVGGFRVVRPKNE